MGQGKRLSQAWPWKPLPLRCLGGGVRAPLQLLTRGRLSAIDVGAAPPSTGVCPGRVHPSRPRTPCAHLCSVTYSVPFIIIGCPWVLSVPRRTICADPMCTPSPAWGLGWGRLRGVHRWEERGLQVAALPSKGSYPQGAPWGVSFGDGMQPEHLVGALGICGSFHRGENSGKGSPAATDRHIPHAGHPGADFPAAFSDGLRSRTAAWREQREA